MSTPTAMPPSNTHDFRSDTVTYPTPRMLAASIAPPSFMGDDVYSDSYTTTAFLSRLASLTGTDHAAYVPAATMGNLASIMSHLRQAPHSLLADARSHVLNYEAGNLATVAGVFPMGVRPGNGKWLSVEDLKEKVYKRGADNHFPPTTVLVLEVPLDGEVMPLSEYQRITRWARGEGIRIHVDGARLWHADVAGLAGLKEVCKEADTVQLCFSKGLGAPGGSAVVGRRECIEDVVWIRKMLGGQGRQTGMMCAMMDVGLDEIFLSGRLLETHKYARQVAERWEKAGGRLAKETQTNMVWLDLQASGITDEVLVQFLKERGITTNWGRLVFHFQHTPESIEQLSGALEELLITHGKAPITTTSQEQMRSYTTSSSQ